MSPVQEGSVVVYVIDNTKTLLGSKKTLFKAFDDLTGGASLPNVKLAALKHGYLWWDGPTAVGTLKNNLFRFSPPDDTLANTLRGKLFLDSPASNKLRYEQLYPGIMAAKEMIEEECPRDVDLVANPRCQRKVIVALSDGHPGVSPESTDYFPQPYADVLLPTNLLSGLKKAGIQVDTLCIGYLCEYKMGKCGSNPVQGYAAFGPGSLSWCTSINLKTPDNNKAHLRGREIMEELSSHTGGVYHGVAD